MVSPLLGDSSPRRVLRFLSQPLAAAIALATAPSALAQNVDLFPIFAPPTPLEVQAVRDDWATRPLVVAGFRRDNTFTDPGNGFHYEIVSHLVEGERHYAAIKFPSNYVAGGKYPVMVVCHGGVQGVTVEELANLLVPFPGQCVEDDYFLVMPSYRGEILFSSSGGGTYQSEGVQSWADRDVDDTRALLSVALDNYSDMDRARVMSWGVSRGGCVALQLAARDDRIRRVVDVFGFTDLSLPTVVSRVDAIVNQGVPASGLGRLVKEAVVDPYVSGQMSLGEVRLEWLRRSPAYFVADLPPIQAHHGLQDTQVDPTHTQILLDALAAAGVSPSNAEGHYYPSGQHGLNSLLGHGPIVEPFICSLNAGPFGYCGPMTAHGGGSVAGISWGGGLSLSSNTFALRIYDCLPNSAGLFFVSPDTSYTPSGAGYLCLGHGFQRLGLALIDSQGFGEFTIDPTTVPVGAQSLLLGAGSTLYFQFVFRDFNNPGGAWNFSNGLGVEFKP